MKNKINNKSKLIKISTSQKHLKDLSLNGINIKDWIVYIKFEIQSISNEKINTEKNLFLTYTFFCSAILFIFLNLNIQFIHIVIILGILGLLIFIYWIYFLSQSLREQSFILFSYDIALQKIIWVELGTNKNIKEYF